MGLSRHPIKHANRLGSILLALPLILGVVTSLEAQDKALRPSKDACPVIADLFPKQERSARFLKYIFPENSEIPVDKAGDLSRVAQRISISLLTPGGEDIEIRFYWRSAVFTNPRIAWGECSRILFVKGDGNPNCFLLGPSAGLPVNIPCSEFILEVPSGVEIKEVLFSSLAPKEYFSEDCPMPELERQIGEAYLDSRRNPQDDAKTRRFISLLEKAIPEYGCISRYGGYPIPALFLANLGSKLNWYDYLYQKMGESNDYALSVFAGIYNITYEGVLAGVMGDYIWRLLHDKPQFILGNWDGIKNYQRNILESRLVETPESITKMIWIYQDIALKIPKYKSACEEIISILSEKSNSN